MDSIKTLGWGRRAKVYCLALIVLFSGLFILLSGPADAGNGSWSAIGPEGGMITALGIDPANPSNVYVGAYYGGVFKSTNGGGAWAAIPPSPKGNFIYFVTVDPGNSSTLYTSAYGEGAFKSINGGNTWAPLGGAVVGDYVYALAVDPANSSILYAGGSEVFKSLDGGNTWNSKSTGLPFDNFASFVFDPGDSNIVYTGGWYGGVFKSLDGGENWNAANHGLTNLEVLSLAIDPSNPNILYAGTFASGVFKTYDGGQNWTLPSADLNQMNVYGLVIDPANPSTVYAGTGAGIFKSVDGGGSWAPMNNGLSDTLVMGLVIDGKTPATLYAGISGGGIFKTTDAGENWKTANSGLNAHETSFLSVDLNSSSTLYMGAGLNGVFKTMDGGMTWSPINNGLPLIPLAMVIDPSNSNILYVGTNEGVYKSENGGGSWSRSGSGIPDINNYMPAIAIDPLNPKIIYAGIWSGGNSWSSVDDLYKSTDGGLNWTPIQTGLNNFFQIVIDPKAPNILYAGYLGNFGAALSKSVNGGLTWDVVGPSLINDFSTMAIDPVNPNILYVADWTNGLFKSMDGGGSWISINNGLDAVHPRVLAVDPIHPNVVYAGTDKGVFKSIDGGQNWAPLNEGLPALGLNIRALAVDPQKPMILYAGTQSLSVFRMEQPTAILGINCGGPKYVDSSGFVYIADAYFSTGLTYQTTASIAGTSSGTLYQTERFADSFSYNIPLPNGSYLVTLKFAEIYAFWNSPGMRVFDVKVEGKEVIHNLDLFAKAGKYKAYDVVVPAIVTDGVLNIDFKSKAGGAKVNAILITDSQAVWQYTINASASAGGTIGPAGAVTVNYGDSKAFTIAPNTGYHIADVKVDGESQGALAQYTFTGVTANHTIETRFAVDDTLPPVAFAVNCGGAKYVDKQGIVYQADTKFSGGQTYITPSPILGTEDGVLYQSERFGDFSYNIPLPNGSYKVILKFAEIYAYLYGSDSRVFDVKIEGQTVIKKLDLFAKVGGKYKAYDVTIPVNLTDGVLNIEFISVVGGAKIDAILVLQQ